MAEDLRCQWWNNGSVEARVIVPGGRGNVFVNDIERNPWIKVVSNGKVIARRRYFDITPRQ